MNINNNNYDLEVNRIKDIDNLVLPEHYLSVFKKYLTNKQIPHLLFSGPPGVGKTTIAEILAYGVTEGTQEMILEINASLYKGIDTVRDKIESFVTHKGLKDIHKIVLIDEADHLSDAAQASLRRILEKYCFNSRFIFTANYLRKIIQPLQSRCVHFEFKPLELHHFQKIAKNKGLNKGAEEIKNLVDKSEGDVRKFNNFLEHGVHIEDTPWANFLNLLKNPDLNYLNIYKESFYSELMKYLLQGSIKPIQTFYLNFFEELADLDYKLALGCDKLIQIKKFILKIQPYLKLK